MQNFDGMLSEILGVIPDANEQDVGKKLSIGCLNNKAIELLYPKAYTFDFEAHKPFVIHSSEPVQ